MVGLTWKYTNLLCLEMLEYNPWFSRSLRKGRDAITYIDLVCCMFFRDVVIVMLQEAISSRNPSSDRGEPDLAS